MNLKEIKDLIEIFNKSEISKLKIKQEPFEIELEKNISLNETFKTIPVIETSAIKQNVIQHTENPQAQITPSNTSNTQDYILSPMVGTFYHCPSPGAAPYVKVGDTIKKGQTIGIVEAMKIMNEIEAEYDCKVVAIEASDSQPVEFGSKLVKVEKI
ncbi:MULTISPECIES: acetyl-CoA carboxylase biotin carboxyl carrier protein [unclassified Helicobacter]|uniref:acetyl-CoA carboxylase biotin carboxyl carrier protein n=1 Tax=unclassified Helicobacter TaxID=2593540 RepID=UPI000CF1B850|nr:MULTISPECIES: acetyl-CoA carboxylase biotin carboxyl carrier protein [unclassified Helicobacter]